MQYPVKQLRLFGLLIALLFAGACRTTLAPDYDQRIVDRSDEATIGVLELFAVVSDGAEKVTFPDREKQYNTLIARFDALALMAKSRPVPSGKVIDKINETLRAKGTGTVSGQFPSAVAFEEIAKTLQKMKEKDRAEGLKPLLVSAFKGQVVIYLDQAITYERFLKRE